jgi:hypothetical protein
MKRYVSAVALLLLVGVGARADQLTPDTVQWTYNFTPGAPAITADGNPNAGVSFTNQPPASATGSSDIVATNLRVFSADPGTNADHITGSNGNYNFTLVLTETENGNTSTATLHFTGTLSGSLSKDNANIKNVFGANATQTGSLGSFNFTVAMNSFTPPGPPVGGPGGAPSLAGAISAHVSVSSLTPAQVPEPSTMLLSALGMSFLGGAVWRKRRARGLVLA